LKAFSNIYHSKILSARIKTTIAILYQHKTTKT